MKAKNPKKHPIIVEKPRKKKALGQHFLRKQSVVDHMIDRVRITKETSVLEIGCGDGFLTRSILTQTSCRQLVCYEIDPEWAAFVTKNIIDPRLEIRRNNILEVDLSILAPEKPWVLLSNLPYQITFPILFLLQKHKTVFEEGVVMMQEEVAQKLVSARGRTYSATGLFLQHHFQFELMEKIEPGAFSPPPKVFSRLIYFKPKLDPIAIVREDEFWQFVRLCFRQPRRTLRNNLKSTHYDASRFTDETLNLRAQQVSFDDLLKLWAVIVAEL